MATKVRADLIARELSLQHARAGDAFFTQAKNGSTWVSEGLLILDAVAIKKSWTKPCITGYEIKVDRGDFLRDEKWIYYREYCHRMYLVCPTGLIQPEELPADTGLKWYNPEKETFYTKKKAIFRDIELPVGLLYYLVISRLDQERHPFFSDTRERLEAWLENKCQTRSLGKVVQGALFQRLLDMEDRLEKTETFTKRAEKAVDQNKALLNVLEEFGIGTWYQPEENLRKALSVKLPPKAYELITNISCNVNSLVKLVNKEEESEVQVDG